MTNKHKAYFIFWLFIMFLANIKKGRFVKVYSEDKKKYIAGVIQYMEGISISEKKYSFGFSVHWLEPVQGFDSRRFIEGRYTYKDIIIGNLIIK